MFKESIEKVGNFDLEQLLILILKKIFKNEKNVYSNIHIGFLVLFGM